MSSLIERVNARIEELSSQRDAVNEELAAIAADPEARGFTNTDEALARVAELREEGARLNADLDEANKRAAELAAAEARNVAAAPVRPANVGGAVVRSEAHTYTQENRDRSFFADAFRSQFHGDRAAAERIERHMREVEVERRDITSTTLNGLVPPLYLLDQAATLARAMRPFADAVPGYALPADGMTVYATRVTTGTAAAVQSTQNTAATETDMVTTDIAIPVVTILGQQDISRQALERGAVTDQLIFNDLIGAYQTALDANLISGSGSNGQHTGILSVASIATQTWTGTSVASFMSKLNGALADVAGSRYAPATAIIMHPRRWHWLLSGADTVGRNLVTPYAAQADSPWGLGGTGYGPVGNLAGLPVITDANVPSNLGASTNEDRVIVTRMSDHALWENGVSVFRFEQAVNPPATVRLAVAGYSAFTAGRYPSATSVIVGTGLVPPAF